MNLVVFPFHDFRKCQKEGFRTRDGHIMEHLLTAEYINKLIIINRPINILECIIKRISWKTEGIIVEKRIFYQIVEIKKNKYVLDFLNFNLIGTILKKKESFFDAYENKKFIKVVNKSIKRLKLNNSCCLSFTLYAFKPLKLIDTKYHIFDALDNWLRIPSYKKFFYIIYNGYKSLSKSAKIWTTNSIENKKYFENEFNLKDCVVIRNGVDIDTFNKKLNMPKDMEKFKKPIIGIAAKITHIIDVDFLNHVVKNNNNYDFILIGQILDKNVFKKISKRVYYLGDKHYNEYPSYVKNFDICFIPYVVGEGEHGGDSIKLYEFLAAKKNIISTNFAGVQTFKNYIKIVKLPEEFKLAANECLLNQKKEIPNIVYEMTWKIRTRNMMKLFE